MYCKNTVHLLEWFFLLKLPLLPSSHGLAHCVLPALGKSCLILGAQRTSLSSSNLKDILVNLIPKNRPSTWQESEYGANIVYTCM
jgi:hypothetical protein